MISLPRVSYGTTSAVTTSMGLTIGLHAAHNPSSTIVSGLLIIALADNISDSLSIHIYQESEKLESRSAFRTTLTNFMARLVVTGTFAAMALLAPSAMLTPLALAWGLGLLSLLSYFLARERRANIVLEIAKHVGIAVSVITVSALIGVWLHASLG
jgi:vacuolar iron transporter family protein